MIVAIVGNEARAWTATGEANVREFLDVFFKSFKAPTARIIADKIISGACPKGGVDIWAIEIARAHGFETEEFPPTMEQWHPFGYRARNERMARQAAYVLALSPAKASAFCDHCAAWGHVKSGGCWTLRFARKIGHDGRHVTIPN